MSGFDKTVLLFEASMTPANRRAYDGIHRYAKAANWNVHVIEYSLVADKRNHPNAEKAVNVAEILDLWHPDGIILECAGKAPVLPLARFGRLPIVILDCHPSLFKQPLPCVYTDAQSIAKLAAREMLFLGLKHTAYLTYAEPTAWGRERGEAFARIMDMNGIDFHNLTSPTSSVSSARNVEKLADELMCLPRPCGVFAVNDKMARLAVSACERAGLSIPGEMAVVGVDNDESICENAAVSITSVQINFDACGRYAAHLLDRQMSMRRHHVAESIAAESTIIERRQSTQRYACADCRVMKALEFIRRNACSGITPRHVVEKMGCSRRLADLRFSELVHHSILDEIHAVRIDRAKKLLMNPEQVISAIPNFCGYRTLAELCRDFKKQTGQTLREWRKRDQEACRVA